MRGALTLRIAAALVPVLTSTATVDAAPRPAVLEATTRADWWAAGLDGTGCYWSPRRGGPIVFVAAGDKALTKVNGRVVILNPRRDARDLFPFTHDAWRSGDLTIRVVDTARIRAMGYETVTTDAALIITRRDVTTRLRGSMICGS
ncbi:hypothetical protein SOM26_16115 [Sphingomonas sp. CFBP8993]|uniref:hypothetical protein n=1 Tax=Sphingomonas sp. CFBP8993 TaxID=3096526 RepID=UPI002A6AB662|nr:hypothetical protein [Sphingomonas sp. CFBP8993]MDY0960221.1 hypothetical protein [Sphingomonas sp. CFBP8993]